MNLFGFLKKDNTNKFRITEADRDWVEGAFLTFIEIYDIGQPIEFTANYFPNTFSNNKIECNTLLTDLCELLKIDQNKISIKQHRDLRDTDQVPFEIKGKTFEFHVEKRNNSYKIHLANSLNSNERRLTYGLICACVQIRLFENLPDALNDDIFELLALLAAVYFGFGVIISQNLIDIGKSTNSFGWERSWTRLSNMPNEVMAFALATYSSLLEADNLEWTDDLPKTLKTQFIEASAYLLNSPFPTLTLNELKAETLCRKADNHYDKNQFEKAILLIEEAVELPEQKGLKSYLHNNWGYHLMRLGEYEKSIPQYKKAIELDPQGGFAYDNLGYSLIQLGKLEEGKQQLELALKTSTNDDAYSFRNLALYYWKNDDLQQAETYFQKAFETETIPVDLLELHYANFLRSIGEVEKSDSYLNIAVKKGEPEAIARKSELMNQKT